jgi:hypothetical protein
MLCGDENDDVEVMQRLKISEKKTTAFKPLDIKLKFD